MIPDGFDYQELIDFLLSKESYPTVEEVQAVEARLGRNYGPSLLADLWAEGALEPEVAAVLVADFWSMAEYPQDCLDDETWRALFDFAGYTDDGKAAQRPDEPITLYRGSTEVLSLRWSWTDDIAVAEWFANRPYGAPGDRAVWTALVEPWRLLARIHDASRSESEYVVDTTGLEVAKYQRSITSGLSGVST